MPVSAGLKYIVGCVLGLLLAAVTYFSGHPELSEASLISLGLVLIPLALHDLEESPTPPASG